MTIHFNKRRFLAGLILVAGLLPRSLSAQNITSAQNPASNTLTGLPNYGIAPGSIFVLYGSGLGPSSILSAPALPLLTTLGGTSIQVTSAGVVYTPFILYTLSSQVAAVMPSNVPAGPASIQVTYNGTAGPSFVTTILTSAFGISTMNQSGAGPAVVTYPTATAPYYALVTSMNSAQPGSTYTLWGTGLGAANSDDNIATNGDLGTAIQLFIGGVAAPVTYRGRSASPGLDQINFTIPAGLSGCNVSLVVQLGDIVSNTATVPVAPTGGTCSDPATPSALGAAINNAIGKGGGAFGSISMSQGTSAIGNISQTFTMGSARFNRSTPSELTGLGPVSIASYGSCTVIVLAAVSASVPVVATATGLDAGAAISVSASGGGSFNLAPGTTKGTYSSNNLPAWPAGGKFAISASGGGDVGGFAFDLPVPPALTWTNQAALALTPIPRSQPVTVTWTGGNANGYITVSGGSSMSASGGSFTSVQFSCTTPSSAGKLTIPPPVLLSLPSLTQGASGTLAVGSTTPVAFSAPGLDVGYAYASSFTLALVYYK